jgi:hypothetical protein
MHGNVVEFLNKIFLLVSTSKIININPYDWLTFYAPKTVQNIGTHNFNGAIKVIHLLSSKRIG